MLTNVSTKPNVNTFTNQKLETVDCIDSLNSIHVKL